ncbi:MAG: hypothetical protein WA989_05945 [Henriciella sp.]|uniref:ATP-grasp domain-containing protein n=1 Tax=Henriciella sp. TaxID=1968823 RepID=UPI003C723146
MHIAYLASQVTMPGSPIRRADAFEHDLIMSLLRPAFEARGARLTDIAWDDPGADWASFDGALIGTAWDYWDRMEEFLAALAAIEAKTPLFNRAALVRWNIHKSYLRDIEAKGARLIPTVWMNRADEASVQAAFDTLGTDDLVLKRQVGAGADGQVRLRRGEPVPALAHPMMAQGFLPSIEREGEFSFIFIDGALSHALIKRPAAGDYRIQSLYGGTEAAVTPPEEDRKAAQSVLNMLGTPPLYARVDMVRGEDGGLLLMELELIEPYLYPEQGPQLGDRLADAVLGRL